MTRKASAPAQGMTQSNRWMGSEIGARREVLVERQRLLHQRMREVQRVGALGDADLAEILARGAVALHVVAGDQREARIGAARAVGIDGILGEAREGRRACARKESTWLVSPATQTTNSASPHCTARAARRRATTPLAPPNGTWSSQRGDKPEMLGEADRGVGADGEARQRQAVDVGAAQARLLDHLAHGAADPPVRGVGRIAPVRDGDRCGDDDAVVGLSPGLGAHCVQPPTSP